MFRVKGLNLRFKVQEFGLRVRTLEFMARGFGFAV